MSDPVTLAVWERRERDGDTYWRVKIGMADGYFTVDSPVPPGDDAPTLQDVANVTAAATYLVRYVLSDDPYEVAEMAASAARLRAALDALDRKDTP